MIVLKKERNLLKMQSLVVNTLNGLSIMSDINAKKLQKIRMENRSTKGF